MRNTLKDSELYESVYRERERRSSYRFVAILLVILALFLGIRYYWSSHFGGVRVDGESMNYTLQDGDYHIVQYTKYKQAKRGDIIVVHVEDYPELQAENANKAEADKVKYLIKRLIAIEGDTLYCKEGQIYIRYAGTESFVELDEPYAYYDPSDGGKKAYSFAEYTVGDGRVFFLGDNRHNSIDSRYQEEQGSHLKNGLYQEKDIFAVVPAWAIQYQTILEKIFF